MSAPITILKTAAAAFLAAYYFPVVHHWLTVLGFLRSANISHVEGEIIRIEDTIHCEDIHRYSDWLFTACEDSFPTRFSWFPPLVVFKDPVLASQARGSIHVIDTKDFKSKRLVLQNFEGSFTTHGIDIIADPEKNGVVYIFAVNHAPHPEYVLSVKNRTPLPEGSPKARSQIEVFHHALGSSTAKWIRSIRHPLIKTPNDIFGHTPTSIYITNDHHYTEGLLRQVEAIIPAARWSNTVRVQIDDWSSSDPQAGINASIALTGLHNNNGLGHGPSHEDVAIGSAASGILSLADITDTQQMKVKETIYLDSTIDNPSYFKDEYATEENDASGYVLGGLTKAGELAKSSQNETATEPVIVWLVQPVKEEGKAAIKWNKKIIFEDDGSRIRSSSAAVLLGIDPALEGGKKRAWLVVTGFLSSSAIGVKVDL
uniref:Serum paraoxonase/arylesterase family protein n=1 Tax=Bionectria ochroleuca TaxID=29856 RepID=A0A8H7N506_BIOOC